MAVSYPNTKDFKNSKAFTGLKDDVAIAAGIIVSPGWIIEVL